MNLRIIRNYLVGMMHKNSRIGEVERVAVTSRGRVRLAVKYLHNKEATGMFGVYAEPVSIEVREVDNEKYIAKKFAGRIEEIYGKAEQL